MAGALNSRLSVLPAVSSEGSVPAVPSVPAVSIVCLLCACWSPNSCKNVNLTVPYVSVIKTRAR